MNLNNSSEDISAQIKNFTQKCFTRYQNLREANNLVEKEFWDAVVLTACDDDQKRAFEIQLEDKQQRRELPQSVYAVVADQPPVPGCKIGAGGSTFLVIDALQKIFHEKLIDKKVLLIHAGGWSQRLPSASVLGKLFMPLPIGAWDFDMLDVKLALYLPFMQLMGNGIFLTASDDIELFTFEVPVLLQDQTLPGIVALGHPSNLQTGLTHGVFVSAEQPPDVATFISCKTVLQKPSIQEMQSTGAIIQNDPKCDQFVITDSAYWFDAVTVDKFNTFYMKYGIPKVEVDCYGDFLRPLGSNPDPSYLAPTKDPILKNVRTLLNKSLHGSPLQVLFLPKSQFFHLGTITEYLDNLTVHDLFRTCLEIPKIPIMHSDIRYANSISAESVLEFCYFDLEVEVGAKSFISSCSTEGITSSVSVLRIPPRTFMYTAALDIYSTESFVTVFCGINDDIKRTSSLNDLSIFGRPFEMLPSEVKAALNLKDDSVVSMWTAQLFEVCSTPGDAFVKALQLIHSMTTEGTISAPQSAQRISMADILKFKDVSKILDHRRQMRLISNPSALIRQIFELEVNSVKPTTFMRKCLSVDLENVLHVTNFYGLEQFTCKMNRNICLFGAGKAALGMFSVLYDILRADVTRGILFLPTEIRDVLQNLRSSHSFLNDRNIQVIFGGTYNLPDESSVDGTKQILEFLSSVHQPEVLICAISGGASALLVKPSHPVTLSEKLFVIKNLAAKGATIQELNTVRGNLSEIKCGGLRRSIDPHIQSVSLILSDIIGDPLELIGGAPTVYSSDCDKAAAVSVLEKYNLWSAVPGSVKRILMGKIDSEVNSVPRMTNVLVLNNAVALEAGRKIAITSGLQSAILTRSLHGEASYLGEIFAKLVAAVALYRQSHDQQSIQTILQKIPGANLDTLEINWEKPFCLLSGGESTVRVSGCGAGGRNQEMGLAFTIAFNKENKKHGMNIKGCFLTAGSDGQDGPTDSAGVCISFPLSWNAQSCQDAISSLTNNDSYNYFDCHQDIGKLIKTGLTGTNVMDFQILIVV